jgi:signal transduction histidine kinase
VRQYETSQSGHAADGRRGRPFRKHAAEGARRTPGEVRALHPAGDLAAMKPALHSPAVPARPSSDLWLDAGIALVVFAFSVGLLAAGDGIDAVGVALTAAATLPLVFRRRAPLSVFAVTGLASTILRLVAAPSGPPLGPTVALYTIGTGRSDRRVTLALAVLILGVHLTATGLVEDRFPGPEIAFAVVLWGGAWLAGERTRLRGERMAELEERAARAEREAERERRLAATEERMKIARDLHDSAGHAINVILVHAGLGRLRVEDDPAAAKQAFETIEAVARETVSDIDQLVGVLRDGPAGDVEPPTGLAAFDGLVERHRAAGLDVETKIHGDRAALPAAVDQGVYRILQEALTNAARHGGGRADVDLELDPRGLELTVTNPLRTGETPARANGGHGIVGMRERATLLGGRLQAGARNGRYVVRASLPLT